MNTKKPEISIVLPVYNVEEYLSQCLDSILHQTMNDFELICINDGSTDHSLKILEEYASKDERMQIYSQTNQSLGHARNTGMDIAQGKYLLFLDSDDFFDLDMLKKLHSKAEETDADFVLCQYYLYNSITGKTDKIMGLNKDILKECVVFSWKDFPDNLFEIARPNVWMRLYRKAFLDTANIRFQVIPNTEDVYFTSMGMVLGERISWLEDPLVYYRYGRKSSLESQKEDHPLCLIWAEKNLYDELNRRGIYQKIEKAYVNRAVDHSCWILDRFSAAPYSVAAVREVIVYDFIPNTSLLNYPDDYYKDINKVQRLRELINDTQYSIRKMNETYHELKGYKGMADSIQNSVSFRIGRIITFLPRKIRDLLKKRIGERK